MAVENKIDIDIFKVVTKAIAESDDSGIMANHLAQLLVAALGIKGCSIFVLDPETKELEILASFGLSLKYLNKGPILSPKSISFVLKGEPVVIGDVEQSNRLQYPEDAKAEGIRAIASIPIMIYRMNIGVLRLYHHEPWDLSPKDLDSLLLLSETIGLAMTYTRVLNALQAIEGTLNEVHPVWLNPK